MIAANAESHFTTVVNLSKEISFKTYLWKAYAGLSDIRAMANNKEAAVQQMALAIQVVEDLKARVTGGEVARAAFANDESVLDLYQKMAVLLQSLGRDKEALGYLEKSNMENLALRYPAREIALTPEARQKQAELNKLEKQKVEELSKPTAQQSAEKIARLDQMQSIAEKDFREYIDNLAIKDSSAGELKRIDADQFRTEISYIPGNVAVISYLVTPGKLILFIAMKDSLVTRQIPINKSLLEKKINQFYRACAGSASKFSRGVGEEKSPKDSSFNLQQLSHELYEVLLQPAIDIIRGKEKIAIVPTNLFSFIPFAALAERSFRNDQIFWRGKEGLLCEHHPYRNVWA